MDLFLYILLSLLGFGWWWIAFVGLVFCAARYTPWPCIPLAFLIVAALVFYLNASWIEAEMAKPGWNGSPDLDIVFLFAVLFRIALVSIILSPIAIIGLRLKQRGKASSNVHTAA
jgi:hypothetical protein